jgi:hypothetical protein
MKNNRNNETRSKSKKTKASSKDLSNSCDISKSYRDIVETESRKSKLKKEIQYIS